MPSIYYTKYYQMDCIEYGKKKVNVLVLICEYDFYCLVNVFFIVNATL